MSQETEKAGFKGEEPRKMPQQMTLAKDGLACPKNDQPQLKTGLNLAAPAQDILSNRGHATQSLNKINIAPIKIVKVDLDSDKMDDNQRQIDGSPETPKAPASSGNINDEYDSDGMLESNPEIPIRIVKRPSTMRNLIAPPQKQHTLETAKKPVSTYHQTSKQVVAGAGRLEQSQFTRVMSTNNQSDNIVHRQMGLSQNMKGVTTSSYPGGANLNAISNGNISINTSTNKLTFDEEDNLDFSDEDEAQADEDGQNDADSVDNCVNMRFVKHNDCISKRKLRTIHRGYDNESGCEIAWTTYTLHHYKREQLLNALDQVKEIHHTNILRVFYYEIRKVPLTSAAGNHRGMRTLTSMRSSQSLESSVFQSSQIGHHQPEELIVVSELITAGSIREYLKKIKTLRLNVIKKWCLKVLEALEFLHQRGIVHGELSCETIYINSNNGEIKVGDVGIKHIHTLSKAHELGSCKRYRDEKGKPQVDVFCFGLTLLEMVAASEISPGRFTLKYIIRIMNEDKKNDLLSVLTYEPMKDFLQKALEDDPKKRNDVKQLLGHPFLRESSTAENNALIQLSVGMNDLIEEQIAYFKQQRDKHHTSKISNSLHHSMLNDSAQKKYRSTKKNLSLARAGQTTASQPTSKLARKHELRGEQSSSIDIASASANAPGTMAAQVSTITDFNDVAVNAGQTNIVNGAGNSATPDTADPTVSQQIKVLSATQGAVGNDAATRHEALPQKSEGKRQKKLIKGKTTSLLEVPYSANQRRRKKQVQTKPNGLCQLRDGSKGFASATYPSYKQRKFSMGSSVQATQTKLSPDGETSQTNSEEVKNQQNAQRYDSAHFGDQIQNSDRLSQTRQRPPPIQVDNQEEQLRQDEDNIELEGQPPDILSPTQTQTTENVIHFRIQIMTKGRKSDVKFPFDLLKDTPEAVANELQDYYKQNGSELPARAIEAIKQEIKRGIDSHYQFQQPTILEGSQAQTQHSYTNTVVISKVQDKSPPSRKQSSRLSKSQFSKHGNDDDLLDEQEGTGTGNEIDERALMEERAQRREQAEVEQQLAHDYLSKLAIKDSDSACGSRYNLSTPEIESSLNESREIQEKGSMQAEIMEKLNAGQITIDEFEFLYQQARRKVSISHCSDHRNNPDQLYQENGLAINANAIARKYANSSIEELQSENSAAKIEIEPQFSYNNTTGERHGQMIQEQQKNGPYGQQDILLYRNSIEYNDPDLVNFMHNPDKDRHRKDRTGGERKSVKSEEQEDLWLLREMFPNYAQNYHENYVNNYLNYAAQPTQLQHSSAADIHTSMYTTDLSFHSQEGSHHFLNTQRSDLQLVGEPPFQSELSVIMLPQNQTNQTQTSGLITIAQPRSGIMEETQIKPVSVNQPVGDSSSQQYQMHSYCDEAQVNKNVAQQSTNAKSGFAVPVPIHQQSFLQDFSESIIKGLVEKDPNRPPSGLSQQTPNQISCKNGAKLNNSHNYTYGGMSGSGPAGTTQCRNNTILLQTQPSTIRAGNPREYYSFHTHQLNATKRAAIESNANAGIIAEMPDAQQPLSSGGSGTQDTKTSKLNTLGSRGQLGSQISDSQNNSHGLTHRHQRTGQTVQHAITYSKDHGQIKVISSSTEHSITTANQLLQVQQQTAKEDDQQLNELIDKFDPLGLTPVPGNVEPFKTTPSVVDIRKNPESQKEEDQSVAILRRARPHKLKTQVSIKGFPNIVQNQSSDTNPNNSSMTIMNQNQRISAATSEYQNPLTQSSSNDYLTEESSITASDRLSPSRVRFPTSQSKNKFSWRDSSDKMSAASSVASMSTATKDLQRLLEVKKRGMKSERLTKGLQQGMLKKDVNNCKFMLNLLAYQGQDNLSSNKSDISASTKFDQLLIENGHYDRHTRSFVKRFKKHEGLIGDSSDKYTVDKVTWDALIDCAIQFARAQINVNRVVPLESVQEQEEDQRFEETQQRLETLCEAAYGEDDEEESKGKGYNSPQNHIEESSQEQMHQQSYVFNEEQSFSSLKAAGASEEKVVVKGRFSTIFKLADDTEDQIPSVLAPKGSDSKLITLKGQRLAQFAQRNIQSVVFESTRPADSDLAFRPSMLQVSTPESSNSAPLNKKFLERKSSSTLTVQSINTPSFSGAHHHQ